VYIGVYERIDLSISMFIWVYPGVFRCIQVHLRIFDLYSSISRCIRVCLGVSRCIQVYLSVSRCIHMYPGVSECIEVYPCISGVSECIQVYLGVSRCIRVYSRGSRVTMSRAQRVQTDLFHLMFLQLFWSVEEEH